MNEFNSKKQFVAHMSSITRSDRITIATELYQLVQPRLMDERIPGSLRSHIAWVWNRIRVKKRATDSALWQLWVMAMKPTGDLKNWRMPGNQCYRVKPSSVQFPYSRPRTTNTRTRRATIRDCNGDSVSRRWLDRFAPHIRTQADWDSGSIYRGNSVKFSK